MGACDFRVVAKGKTAAEAFETATSEARHEHGHGGYSGTIAEKWSFRMIDVPAGTDPRQYATDLMDADDPRVSDKWGPAACVNVGDGQWLFFGWASS